MNKKTNTTETNYKNIIEQELKSFAQRMGIAAPTHGHDVDMDEYNTCLNFKDVDIFFYYGDFMPYGYSFLENKDSTADYCLLTRFKFPFSRTYYSPYDIHNAINCKDFRTLDFHTIDSEKTLRKSLATIIAFIENNLTVIKNISNDLEMQRRLKSNYSFDMAITSKKITNEVLNVDFLKYTSKHEVNLNCYNQNADMFLNYIYKGKVNTLSKYLAKQLGKGKLLVFEQRFYKHLEDTNYEGVSIDVKHGAKLTKSSTFKEKLGNILVLVASGVVSVGIMIVSLALFEVNMGDSLSFVIGSYYKDEAIFGVVLFALFFVFNPSIKNIFVKKSHSSDEAKAKDKRVNGIIRIVAVIVVIASTVFAYYTQASVVSVEENGIYIGTYKENEILPFDTNKIEFYLIEGSSQVDENGKDVYTVYEEGRKEIYIVVDGDTENYFVNSTDYGEQTVEALKKLKEKNIKLISVKDHEAYWDTYVYTE